MNIDIKPRDIKLCECGCNQICNSDRRYIQHHHKIGKKNSKESNLKNSLSHKGKYKTEETKLKMSLAKLGIPISEEHKQKIKQNSLINNNFGMKGKYHTNFTKNKMSIVARGKHKSEEHKKNLSKSLMGNKLTPEAIQKIKENAISNPNYGFKGRTHTDLSKQKIRIKFIDRLLKNGIRVGNGEKKILDNFEIVNNCKIFRQYNTGIGYFVDGYCKETNTVYEIYEKYHKKNVLKDLERENKICNFLGCDFIITWI